MPRSSHFKFKDSPFMTMRQKELVLSDWAEFLPLLKLDDPLPRIYQRFTNDLYKHLTLHCSYIAHYDRHGFIETYFADPEDTPRFLQQFERDKGYVSYEYGMTNWLTGDYGDINRAMCGVFEPHKSEIYDELRCRVIANKRRSIGKLKQEIETLEIEIMGE